MVAIESRSANLTPAQIEQEQEGARRNRPIVDDAGNEVGADQRQTPINDGTGNELDPPIRQQRQTDGEGGDGEGVAAPFRGSPSDQKRMEIAARFKRNKDGESDPPFNGNPNDPEMQYGKVARQQLEPEPGESIVGSRVEPEPRAAQIDEQQMITRTVRGKSVTKTLSEWLEDASKVSAADSYMDEGRALLEDARALRRDTATRTGQEPHHPEGQTGAQDDDLNLDRGTDRQHPDDLIAAIEEIQFGDPKKAARDIRKVIAQASDESADARQLKRLIDNDLAVSQTSLREFMDQNPELKNDERTGEALEAEMYRIYREDITNLGIDPALIPKDNNEVANWHRFYRVDGKNVKTAAQCLIEAKSRFDTWRGVPSSPKPAPQRQQPRIEVDVDRRDRRLNIQNQPSRAVAPRPDAVRQAPERKSRHDIIMEMRRSRGRPVG